MKKFILKILIFIIPAVIYISVVAAIDPFNYFKITNIIRDDVKLNYSLKINYGLWKVLRFKESNCPNVILGDSRVEGIDYGKLEKVTGEKYFDFAIGGGTLQEMVSAFDLIKSRNNVKNLYFGVCINLNSEKTKDRIKGAVDIINNPFLYFTNVEVIESSILCAVNNNSEDLFILGQPTMSREEFWDYLLKKNENEYLKSFRYPEEYIGELKKISAECEIKKINLFFFQPPSHIDFRNMMHKYSLDNNINRFKEDLMALGAGNTSFADFEDKDSILTNKESYSDPFHVKKDILTDLFIEKVLKK